MGILQVFDSFYKETGGGSPKPGDIYWVPAPDVDEVPRILDVVRADAREHEVTSFEIKDICGDHFQSRERLPIKRLNLGQTEELLISKGKKRPAVVLASSCANDVDTLPEGQRRLAGHLSKRCYLVAPCYSVSSMLKPGTFGPVLVARIRALQYVHLFCLPDPQTPGEPDSIVRLDRVFPTYLGRGCNAKGQCIHPEPFEILLSQFSILLGGINREPYELVRGLAQEALPESLRS